MKNHKFRFLIPALLTSLLFVSCTNLDEAPVSQVTPENFFKTEDELLAAVIPVYNSARLWSWSEAAHLQEVSSDEIFVPTRGGDWDDNGRWRAIHQHTWTPTLVDLRDGWLDGFRGVAFANSTIENLEASTSGSELVPVFIAEVRVLRAFYYWWMMILFFDG